MAKNNNITVDSRMSLWKTSKNRKFFFNVCQAKARRVNLNVSDTNLSVILVVSFKVSE